MNDNSLALTLGKIPLFYGLDPEELRVVLATCKAVSFVSGDSIFSEGDPSHNMYIVLSGGVEICTQKSGCLHTLGSCDIFGEIGLITQRTRSASAIARSDCKLLRIDHLEFNLLAGKHPRISACLYRNISSTLANHVLRMNNSTVLEHIPQVAQAPVAKTGPQVVGRI